MFKDIFFKCHLCQTRYRIRIYPDEKLSLIPCPCGAKIDLNRGKITATEYNSTWFKD